MSTIKDIESCINYLFEQARAGVEITKHGTLRDVIHNADLIQKYIDMERFLGIYETGYEVGYDDLLPCSMMDSCPYPKDSKEYDAWQDGYDQGVEDC